MCHGWRVQYYGRNKKLTKAKIEVTVCMGSACFARGNAQNLEFIENYIKEHNLNAEIELAGARCENKCAEGPNITINGVSYNKVDEKIIEKILSELNIK